MQTIKDTISLLHSMVLSGEKTDGTVTKMVQESLKKLDEISSEQKAIYDKVMQYFPQGSTFVDILQAIDLIANQNKFDEAVAKWNELREKEIDIQLQISDAKDEYNTTKLELKKVEFELAQYK